MDDWYKQLSDAIDSTPFRWDQYTMVQKKCRGEQPAFSA